MADDHGAAPRSPESLERVPARALFGRPPDGAGLGLRLLVLAALGLSFALSITLLGLVTTQLGERALALDRRRTARAMAEALVDVVDERALASTLEALVAGPALEGAALQVDGGDVARWGTPSGAQALAVERGSRRLTLWLPQRAPPAARALSGLVFLYGALTGAFLLLLTYLLLTRLIVRPVEVLTEASERLARGAAVRVPTRGAAELVRLARSFNAMEAALRKEREALVDRLDELTRTTAELRATQDSLVRSEKLASVGRLAAGVAHEIGNPLSAIRGLLDLAIDEELPGDERRDFVGRASAEAERIHRTIAELLAFARGEDAGRDGDDARADVARVIDDALALLRPQKDVRDLRIVRQLEEGLPAARGSADRLRQVVVNLLINAADALEGRGEIRVTARRAAAAAPGRGARLPGADAGRSVSDPAGAERRDGVELAIEDDGPGIPEEVLPHLFEPFVTTKAPGKGSGLGLAVSLTIVEGLGGQLRAENRPERGARMVVWLPAASEPATAPGAER
ncbi:MAG: sensor histidine kinase [Sandaracinaceae bacterium]